MLAALPRADFQLLRPHLISTQNFDQGKILHEADHEVDQVYFPISGIVSLVVVMQNGKAIETAAVGREGVLGAMSGLGFHKSDVRAIVQLRLVASRISSAELGKAARVSEAINDMCIGYNSVLLMQARVTGACNALHPIEARFCRWLLQTRDRACSDTIHLTQEFLSEMLGVRRTSVTNVASEFQKSGAISYARGAIKIQDLAALKEKSCECYERLKARD